MLKGFLMLKPEASFYVEEIANIVEEDKHLISHKLLIENYQLFASKIYKICHADLDIRFYEIILACIEVEIKLFGNKGLILMTSGNDEQMLDYLKRLDETKSRIRKIISPSKTRCLQAYIDISKLNANCSETSLGTPRIVDENNNILTTYKSSESLGEFVSFYLSYLHTPDVDIEKYTKQIDYVNNSNLRNITNSDYQLIKKYKTFNV